MQKHHLSLIAAALLTVGALPTVASAQDSEVAPTTVATTSERVNSINLNPLGVLFGSYGLNYEYLYDGTHGLLVEGLVSSTSNDDSDNLSYGGSLGYRWHWSGEQNSGFLGLNGYVTRGNGEVTVATGSQTATISVDTLSYGLVGNIGRRWAWDSGFNITLRFGGGWAQHSVSTDSDDAQAKKAVKLMNDLLTFLPIALDGEFSVGYAF